VMMSATKEPGYFAQGDPGLRLSPEAAARYREVSITDRDRYEGLFEGAGDRPVIGEASPVYLYSPQAAPAITSEVPEAMALAILRDPVNRAYSSYLRRRDVVPDSETFWQIARAEEEARRRGASPTPVPLIDGSRYCAQIERVKAAFGERLLVVLYHEFKSEPDRVLRTVQSFLGIEAIGFVPDSQQNASGVARWRWLERTLSRRNRLTVAAKNVLPGTVVDRLAMWRGSVRNWNLERAQRISPSVRSRLIEEYFAGDVAGLQTNLGVDLGRWLTE